MWVIRVYELPTSLTICATNYKIRSDYRAVLDICSALNDPELDDQEKTSVLMEIFYPDFSEMPTGHYQEAVKRCLWFIAGGAPETDRKKQPRLLDWEQDFQYMVAPVNRVLGTEIRATEYLHWWTFLSAYMEIGECLFSQIVRIREKKATGKRLDKADREWYQKNRHLVDFKTTYTEQESDTLKKWVV